MKRLFRCVYLPTLILLVGCSSGESVEKGENKLVIEVKDSLQNMEVKEGPELITEIAKESEQPKQQVMEEVKESEQLIETSNEEAMDSQSLEAEVLRIRDIWNAGRKAMEEKQYVVSTIAEGIEVYSSNGDIRMIEIEANINGTSYSRIYNFSQGRLIFAFLEEGDAHRLYYKDKKLFRWKYTADVSKGDQVVNYDNRTDLQGFNQWGSFALNEANQLYLDALPEIQ